MPAYKPIIQKAWIKGLSAAQSFVSEMPNTVRRIKNLLYNVRGALKTCDGSLIISAFNGSVQTNRGPWTDILYFQPTAQRSKYVGIQKDPTVNLAAPSSLSASDGGASGSFSNVPYYFKVTALDGAGGETTASNEATVTPTASHKIQLNWTAVTNATGYKIYQGTASGSEVEVTGITISTNSYLLTGGEMLGTAPVPVINTTQVCQFFSVPSSSYGSGDIIKTLPADLLPYDADPPERGGGYGTGGVISGVTGGGSSATPAGGVSGNFSPIPQLLQFTDKVLICPGNGLTPYTSDGTTGGTSQITNTFVADVPVWQASTTFLVGDVIKPTVSNGHIFICQQGGKSGGTEPSWPTTTDQVISDGGIIWKEYGTDSGGVAPRGAAHGIIHAGAFWAFNTSPTNTADGLDGPSALRMSDINNPNSWNPINRAFIGKDDGSQGMGLASFTIAEAGIPPQAALVAFKEFSTYMINGVFGSQDFAIQQAQTDMGCIAPRTIQFLPGFGIARLTHLGVAIFDGVRDRIISEEIRPYLFDDATDDISGIDWTFAYFSKATQTATPPMYVMACPIKVATLDTVSLGFNGSAGSVPAATYYMRVTKLSGAMEIAISPEVSYQANTTGSFLVTLPSDSTATKYRVYIGTASGQENIYWEYSGTDAGTTKTISSLVSGTSGTPGFGYLSRIFAYDLVLKAWSIIDLPFGISVLKQVRAPGTIPITVMGGFSDGTLRRWQAGGNDTTWDGTAISWSVGLPHVYGQSASNRTYFRKMLIRGKVPSGNTASLSVKVNLDGNDQSTYTAKTFNLGGGQFEAELPINRTALNANAEISGSGICEIDEVCWLAVPRSVGVVPRI